MSATRLKAARARLRALREGREAARLETQADRLELAGTPAGRPLRESLSPSPLDLISAYSSILDRLRSEPYSYNVTSPYDRKFGRNFPLYQSEAELSLLRAPSRILCGTNTYAQALVGGLKAYIIGPGYTYRAAARASVAKKKDAASTLPQTVETLVEAVQAVVDRFMRRNQWNASGPWAELDQLPLKPIEGEAFERSLRDGEATLLHTWDDDAGETQVRFVEPEFITAPPGGRWEEWSFGWKTPPNDEQRKLAAWISWTGNPAEGDEYPVGRLSYLARNVDRVLKRGMPDFAFDAGDALQTAQRLRRALAVGGAVKASIVGVRQHKGQTQAQTQAFADQLTDMQTVDLVTGQPKAVRRYQPGEWEDIDENMEYVRGPGTDVEGALVEVLGACLRGAVVRWNGFEWLVSADASSNSYANALAAESPAVKRVESEQADYVAFFLRSVAIAVKDAADAGLIRAAGRTWEWLEIRQLVEVQCEAPSAEVRDQQGEAQRDVALLQARIKSVQTICQEQGLDYEREMQSIEEHEERFGGQGVPLELPPDEEGGTDLPKTGAKPATTPKDPKVKQPAAPGAPALESRLGAADAAAVYRAAADLLEGRALLESEEPDDADERAPLMAEILYSLYGDDAAKHLTGDQELHESLRPLLESWDPLHHPRGPNGRFIPRGSAEAVSAAKKVVGKVLKGGPHAHSAEDVAAHLNILTVAQLKDLHKEHGKPIPGKLRAQLVDAVKAKMGAGERPASKPAAKAGAAPDAGDLHARTLALWNGVAKVPPEQFKQTLAAETAGLEKLPKEQLHAIWTAMEFKGKLASPKAYADKIRDQIEERAGGTYRAGIIYPEWSKEAKRAKERDEEAAPKPDAGAKPVDLRDPKALADAVHEAGAKLPDAIGGHKGGPDLPDWQSHKPLIADVYDALKPRLGGATLDDFKEAMFRAHEGGHLSLSRTDLVEVVKDHAGMKRSEIVHPTQRGQAFPSATMHTVNTNSPQARKGKAPEPKSAAKDPHAHVADAVAAHGGAHNLAPLHKVRAHLAAQGVTDRAAQDDAIHEARKRGLVSGVGLEGRHGTTEEERAASLKGASDEHPIGYLSAKQAEDAPRAAPAHHVAKLKGLIEKSMDEWHVGKSPEAQAALAELEKAPDAHVEAVARELGLPAGKRKKDNLEKIRHKLGEADRARDSIQV